MRHKADASLEAAFLAARYVVHAPSGDMVLEIGRHKAELAAFMASIGHDSLALITAFNPYARKQSAQDNALAQHALQRAVNALGLPCLTGSNSGPDGGAPVEPTVVVAGISPAQARALAVRFGQLAYVYADADAVPKLVWTALADEDQHGG